MPLRRLTLLTTLLHIYLALRLVPALALLTPWWPLLLGVLVISAMAMPLPFVGLRSAAKPLPDGLKWLGLIAMGWFSSMVVLTLARDIGLLLTWGASALGGLSINWSGWKSWSAAAVMLMAVTTSLIGFVNARRTAPIKRVSVPISGLSTALEGFTIVQLSDIHVGLTIKRGYIERIVVKVNALQADLIAITGDLVDGSVAELREHIAPLAGLQARHGTFVVTGNHEYYAGAAAWIVELRRLGLRVLLNEHVLLHHGTSANVVGADGDALVLAGVTDFTAVHFDAAQASDPHGALLGAPEAATTRILLAHQPLSAPAAAEAGYQLQLSGHTHGGQFFPWNLVVPLQQPFTAGLHRLRGMWVYVSRGTGYWGPPMRFGAPSEITLLRLVRAA